MVNYDLGGGIRYDSKEYQEKILRRYDAKEPDGWITVNGNHIPVDKNGNAVGGNPKALGRSQKEKKEKLRLMNAEGRFRYHGTTADNLKSIYENGLRPGKKGKYGPGVYVAYSEESAKEWGEEQARSKAPVVALRVSNQYLAGSDYDDWDDEQGVSKETIPSEQIEVKWNGKWKPIKEFFTN